MLNLMESTRTLVVYIRQIVAFPGVCSTKPCNLHPALHKSNAESEASQKVCFTDGYGKCAKRVAMDMVGKRNP